MTALAERPASAARPAPLLRGYRFELTKLFAQWRVRLLVIACWTVPAVFVAGVSSQSALPVDTLFGRWMHATGWAAPLVVLGYSGTWVLPLVTAVVAGDVFAAEDRLGTWRQLLVSVRSPRRIFAAKVLAGLTVVVPLVAGLACSSVVSGLLVVGNRPLVGLDGQALAPADVAWRVLLAWGCVLAPTLALAAIGVLGSVALGRSPVGLLLPVVVALTLQLVQLLPIPVALRLALPGYAFTAWHGLFTEPVRPAPLVIGVGVAVAWAAAATVLAHRLFLRRDFTNPTADAAGRRAVAVAVLPLAGLLAVTVAALVPVTSGGGIRGGDVERSVVRSFAHLYRLQARQLHRPDVPEAQLRASAACTRGGGLVAARGPGNDWRCVVTWHLPGVGAVATAYYQLDISPDGRYVADGDGPKEVNGYFLVHTPDGDAPNPLWQFDGTAALLPTRG